MICFLKKKFYEIEAHIIDNHYKSVIFIIVPLYRCALHTQTYLK